SRGSRLWQTLRCARPCCEHARDLHRADPSRSERPAVVARQDLAPRRGTRRPAPDTIAVTLNRREHGRVVDRVWMRGDFVCATCVWTGTVHWRVVGYTFDAKTHDTRSSSGH